MGLPCRDGERKRKEGKEGRDQLENSLPKKRRQLLEGWRAYLVVELTVPDVLSLYRSHDEKERKGKGGGGGKEKVVGKEERESSTRDLKTSRARRPKESFNQLDRFQSTFSQASLISTRLAWR